MRRWIFIVPLLTLTLLALSVSATVLEKIFTHDRGQQMHSLRKSGRLDEADDYDVIKRAIEEFKESIPNLTGFYFLDFLFELVKSACIFLLTLLAPLDPGDHFSLSNANSMSPTSNLSSNNLQVVDNRVGVLLE